MIKIKQEKIARAVVGSARLEGYKGSVKKSIAKMAKAARTETKPKATVEPKPSS
jgi:hypothetical protein